MCTNKQAYGFHHVAVQWQVMYNMNKWNCVTCWTSGGLEAMHHMIELKIHIVSFVAKTTWKTATCWKTDNRNIKMDLKEVCCENER